MKSNRFNRFLPVAIIALGVSSAHATSFTWDANGGTAGTGGTGNWDTSSYFWNNGVNTWPSSGTDNDAIFGGTAGTVTLTTGISVNDLTFNTTGYTIGGSTLTLNGATSIITATTGVTATISAIIDGTAGMTFVGAGNLILTGANTYTGDTIVSGQGHGGYGGDVSLTLNSSTGPAIQSSKLYLGRATDSGHAVVNCLANNQFGTNTVVYVNGSNYAYINLFGTTQTIAGLSQFNGTGNYPVIQSTESGASGASTLNINTATGTSYASNGIFRNGGGGVLSIVKQGDGTQTLGGALQYTGSTTVSGGRLIISGNSLSSPVLSIASGATMEISTTGTGGVGAPTSISGAGTYQKTGSGLWDMTWGGQAKTISMASGGLIDVQGGTLRMGYGYNANWDSNKADLTVGSGAIFDMWDTLDSARVFKVDALNGAGTVTDNAGNNTLNVGVDNGTGSFSGTITQGSGRVVKLTKSGTGTQTLSGANSYSGTTTVNDGKLIIAGNQTGSGQLIVNNAATLTFGDGSSTNGSSVNSGTIFVNNTGTVQINKADGGTVTNAIASNPGATTTLSGANAAGTTNTFTATSYNNGGGFAVSSTYAGAVLAFSGASGAIDLKGTNLTVSGAGDTLLTSAGQGFYSSTTSSKVIKQGTGTLIFQGNQGFTGNMEIDAGTVRVDIAQTNSGTYFVGNGTTTTTAATLLLGGGSNGLSGGVTFNRSITINPGDGTDRTLGGTNTSGINIFSGTVAMDGTLGENRSTKLTAAAGGTVEFSNVISGAGQNIVKIGDGKVILSGANTYTGTTSVNVGILKLSNAGGFRSATTLNGGSIELAASVGWTMGNGAGFFGTGMFTKTGSGAVLFGGYDYATTMSLGAGSLIDIQEGMIKLDFGYNKSTWSNNLADLNIASGATFDIWDYGQYTGNFVKVDALTGAGTINRGIGGTTSGGLEVGVDNGSGIFEGVIQNSVGGSTISVKKSGTGIQTLTGANTYSGTTTVNGGTLVINNTTGSGTGSGTVTVNNTGTKLKGTGSISGTTTINSGAIHSPGNSVGTQKFTGNLTYSSGSIFEWELASSLAESGRGTSYDGVNVTGSLGGTGAKFRVVLDGTQTFADAWWNSDRKWTDIFTAADGTTAKTNWNSIFGGGFEYHNASSGNLGDPSTEGFFTVTGNSLNWTAVPEPTSALAGLLLGAGVLRRRRSKDGEG